MRKINFLQLFYIVCLFYFIFLSSSQANEIAPINGLVLSDSDDLPIPYALIEVKDHKALRTRADDEGLFIINISKPGKYTMRASINSDLSGESHWIVVDTAQYDGQPISMKITLVGDVMGLLVTEEYADHQVSEIRLNKEEINHVAGSGGDALRAIQSLPGVAIADDDSAEPAVRGSFPGQNLYFVDFLPVGYLFHLNDRVVSVLNGGFVREINFFPSAFGPEYGDKLGGVFDIGLINPNERQWKRGVDLNLLGINVSAQGPVTENQAVLFGYRRSFLNVAIKLIGVEEDEIVSTPQYDDYLAKYIWNVNINNRITFNFMGARDNSAVWRFPNTPWWIVDTDEAYHTQAVIWDSYSGSFSNKMAAGYLSHRRYRIDGPFSDSKLDTKTSFLREKLHYALNDKHALTLGGDFFSQQWIFNNSQFFQCGSDGETCADVIDVNKRINYGAAFLKDRWHIWKNLTLDLGLRLSGNDLAKIFYLEPRLGMALKLNSITTLTAAWGKYNQAPQTRAFLGVNKNSNLKHTRAEHYVVGITNRLRHGWNWKTEVYYKKLWDLLAFVETEKREINDTTGKTYGVEVLIKKDFNNKFSGWLSIAWSKTRLTNNQSNNTWLTEYDQPFIISLVASKKLVNNWFMDVKWFFRSGRPYTPVIGKDPIFESDEETVRFYRPIHGPTNSSRYPNYHRMDVRISNKMKFASWDLETYVEIINIYNRENVSEWVYSFDYSSKSADFQFPIFPTFGLNATF